MASIVTRDKNRNKDTKRRFIKTLNTIGWKMAFDADPNCENDIFDIIMLVTRKNPEKTVCAVEYGFLKIGYNDPISLENYNAARLSPKGSDAFPLYVDNLDKAIHPYDIDDLVCALLHLNHHIEDFYVAKDSKVFLNLTPTLIKELIDEFVLKGSPLYDMSTARRPRKPKERQRTFINVVDPDAIKTV